MAGLIVKDIRIVLSRKTNMVMFLFIGGMITWQAHNTMGLVYMTMLGSLIALGTISYDDADNSMSFLMTLPCTRKSYAIEKYLFIGLVSMVSWAIGSIIYLITCKAHQIPITGDLIIDMIISAVPILLFTCALIIPLQLKYGAERSRVVFLVIFGACAVCIFALSSFKENLGEQIDAIFKKITVINSGLTIVLLLIGMFILTIISMLISIRIMEKKEF